MLWRDVGRRGSPFDNVKSTATSSATCSWRNVVRTPVACHRKTQSQTTTPAHHETTQAQTTTPAGKGTPVLCLLTNFPKVQHFRFHHEITNFADLQPSVDVIKEGIAPIHLQVIQTQLPRGGFLRPIGDPMEFFFRPSTRFCVWRLIPESRAVIITTENKNIHVITCADGQDVYTFLYMRIQCRNDFI